MNFRDASIPNARFAKLAANANVHIRIYSIVCIRIRTLLHLARLRIISFVDNERAFTRVDGICQDNGREGRIPKKFPKTPFYNSITAPQKCAEYVVRALGDIEMRRVHRSGTSTGNHHAENYVPRSHVCLCRPSFRESWEFIDGHLAPFFFPKREEDVDAEVLRRHWNYAISFLEIYY